jgi:hypothetical protein
MRNKLQELTILKGGEIDAGRLNDASLKIGEALGSVGGQRGAAREELLRLAGD